MPQLNLETLEPRLLLSVSANVDTYDLLEDQLFRTGAVTQVVEVTDTWHYHDDIERNSEDYPRDGENQLWNFREFTINDGFSNNYGVWKSASGPFQQGQLEGLIDNGYTPTPLATQSNQHTTVLYLAQPFDFEDPTSANRIELTYLFDDGGIVYLNGFEILRVNMPGGNITTNTFASGNGDENNFNTVQVDIPTNALFQTNNIIAVETHNNSTSSSDNGMGLSAKIVSTTNTGLLANDDLSNQQGALTLFTPDAVYDPITQQQVGTLDVFENGDFLFTPTLPDFFGVVSFDYFIDDASNNPSATTVILNIQNTNDVPIAEGDTYQITDNRVFNASLTQPRTPLVDTGDTWNFLDTINIATETYPHDADGHFWNTSEFDVSTSNRSYGQWKINQPSPFAGGSIDVFNSLGLTTTPLLTPNNSVITTLYRKTINISDDGLIDQLQFEHVFEDGAIVYMNGVEIYRYNMRQANRIDTRTPVSGPENIYVLSQPVPVDHVIQEGPNTIAIEVHQSSVNSSDVGMDVRIFDATTQHGLLANEPEDIDGDNLTVELIDDPNLTQLQLFGDLNLNPDGTFTYELTSPFNGSLFFNYRLFDDITYSDPVLVELQVNPVNLAPVMAEDDSYQTLEDTPLIINTTFTGPGIGSGLLANDTHHPLESQDPISIDILDTRNLNGDLDVNNDGTFTYTPDNNFFGTATFTYTVFDGTAASNTATVNIQVIPTPDPTNPNQDTYNILEDTILTTSVANPYDKLIITQSDTWYYNDFGVDLGTIWRDPDYDPQQAGWQTGSGEFGYGTGGEDTTLSYGDNPNTKNPTAYFYHTFDIPNLESITTLDLWTRFDDGIAIYINGVEVLRTYLTPQATYQELASGDGNPHTRTIEIDPELSNLNLQPTGNTIAVEVHQVTPTSSDLIFELTLGEHLGDDRGALFNDTSPDGQNLGEFFPVPNYGPTNGTFEFNPDGTFTYTPNPNYYGDDYIYYQIHKQGQVSDIGRIWIEIANTPDPIQGHNDRYHTPENTDLNIIYPDLPATQNSIPQSLTIIPQGSTWQYLDDGSDQGTAWRDPDFIDTAWPTGVAELGYGDGDETTTLSYGPDANNKHITTYFRKHFDLPPEILDPADIPSLIVYLNRDDGAALYLNGVEIVRNNLLPMAEYNQLAGHEPAAVEDILHAFLIDLEALNITLKSNNNVIAAEVHQNRPDSSDISFDLQLDAIAQTPVLGVRGNDILTDKQSRNLILVTPPTYHDEQLGFNPFILRNDGTFNYRPIDGFEGSDRFVYRYDEPGAELITAGIIIGVDERTRADFNLDMIIDIHDLDQLSSAVAQHSSDSKFDINQDSLINVDDLYQVVNSPELLNTLAGDSNLDGIVNLEDLARLADHFGQPSNKWSEGDYNADGVVDLVDLAEMATHFGTQTHGGTLDLVTPSSPEPISTGAAQSNQALQFINPAQPNENNTPQMQWSHIKNLLDDSEDPNLI